VEFGKRLRTIGYDKSEPKLAALRAGSDPGGEVPAAELRQAARLEFTSDPAALRAADFILVAVPTPVDAAHQPDFAPLVAASRTIGAAMKRGVTVVYESTVYPGATEEVCIPELERAPEGRSRREVLLLQPVVDGG
jgi:UDP-N-acetyl-D-galactosamine dehydrogenase